MCLNECVKLMLDSYAFIYQQYPVDLFSKVLFLERVFFLIFNHIYPPLQYTENSKTWIF